MEKAVIFPYGKRQIELELPENSPALLPREVMAPGAAQETIVREALKNPIESKPLRELARAGKRIAVVTSDVTRPMPTRTVLPAVLDELEAAGADDVTVVFALGSHRAHTGDERRELLGGAYGRTRAIDSDANDCVHLGRTSRGTNVDIFRPVAEADLRIALGNIEYHYFAGYSGGIKALLPGTSTRRPIEQNHSHMVEEGAAAGMLDGNPVREDIEEVAKFISLDFIVNVVLDERKRVLAAFAGHHVAAHRAGCKYLDEVYAAPIERAADVVVVSAGGHPKDINMYQAQKALDNAARAVRQGGIIVWLAECGEGLGEKTFERWMKSYTPEEMRVEIARRFELGGHKAAAIALVMKKARIFLVSGLESGSVRAMGFTPFDSARQAHDAALHEAGRGALVCAMPYGGSTMPMTASS